MPSGKAPGLDRFSLIFYKKSWPELCPVLMPLINSHLEEDSKRRLNQYSGKSSMSIIFKKGNNPLRD